MNTLASLPLRDLYYAITIEVGAGFSDIYGERRGERMLRVGVRIRIDRCSSYAIFCGSAADTSNL